MATFYVDDNATDGTGDFNDPFGSIQDAIDAAGAEGGGSHTIEIAEGTYTEQVSIDQIDNLTFVGSGRGSTTIESPDGTNYGSSDRAIVDVVDSEGVNFRDLTIDGRGQAPAGRANDSESFSGVRYQNASGDIDNVSVTGVTQNGPGPSGAQGVYGIHVVNDDGTERVVNIQNSFVDEFDKDGIDADGGNNLTLNLTNNQITGAGPTGANAQNGLSLANVAGSVTGNTIQNIGYTGDVYSGSLISTSDLDGVNFSDNILVGADDPDAATAGIFLEGQNVDFLTNELSDVSYGVVLYPNTDAGTIRVQENEIATPNGDPFSSFDLGEVALGPNEINGTAYDTVYVGSDEISGTTINGVGNNISGTSLNDFIAGRYGDDTLNGGGGNDSLAGGAGLDVAQIADGGGGSVAMSDFSFSGESVDGGTYQGAISTPEDGTDTVSGVELLEVTNTGSSSFLVRDGMSIQAAIDAAEAGDTVIVGPGSYDTDGPITVDEDITLRGPNFDSAGNANSRGDEATIDGQIVVNATGATVEGFTVSPDPSKLTDNPSGEVIRVSGGADNVRITNNVVRDVDGSSLSEGLDGINVFGGDSTDAVEQVEISNNLVTSGNGPSNNGFSGISVQGNVVDANVSENAVNDIGDSSAFAFGIVVRATGNHSVTPSGVTVSGNDIRNVSSNGNFSYSAGVGIGLESEHTGVDSIEENTVRNVDFLLEEKDFPSNYDPDSDDNDINNSNADIPAASQILIDQSDLQTLIDNNNWQGAYVVDSDGNLVTGDTENSDGDVVVFDRVSDANELADSDDTVQVFDTIPSTGGGGNPGGGGGGAGGGAGPNLTPGNDNANGNDGSETLPGGEGDDTVSGNNGNDEVYGNQGQDEVYGNQGDDLVFGGQDNDLAFGGQDNDQVYGNKGDDQVYGNQGDDDIFGGQENDDLFGGQDGDLIYGNQGDDRIYGNKGTDTLFGGEGADEFAFLSGDGQDTVADFADGDTIALQADINGTGIGSFDDLEITENENGDAVIDLGDDNSLTIQGVSPGELSESDFSFF